MTGASETGPEDLREVLRTLVAERAAGRAFVREPLLGFADAADPFWHRLRRVAHEKHRLPEEILPGARSVVAWFLPFQPFLLAENREGEFAVSSWSEAYVSVNELLAEIAAAVTERLAAAGFRAASDPPTHRFDPLDLVAAWSHKHAAYVCGLGTFGVHRMLITAEGAGGRLGSIVTDAVLAPTPRGRVELCRSRAGEECLLCTTACPIGALGPDSFDRHACWERCLENESRCPPDRKADVCGKCVAVCPAPGVRFPDSAER